MNVKDTIKALLKKDFGGVQLSAARVEELAKRMEGKVESEDDVKAKLEAFNELKPLSELASEDDRARTVQAELEKLKKKEPKSDDAGDGDGEGDAGDTSKSKDSELLALLKEMKNEISSIKGEKIVTDRRSAILAKLKDADEAYSNKVLRDFGRMTFTDDTAFDEYLSEVETDFTSFKQITAESQLGKDAPFVSITDSKGQVSDATVEEIVNNL